MLINIKYKQLREMVSSIREREVKRKTIKLMPITQLPPFNYYNAALHTYRFKHTLTNTHAYSCTH